MGRDKRRGLSRLPWVFGLVVLMVGVCALALAVDVPSARLPILPVRVGPRMLAVAGGLFVIASLVIVLLPTRLGLRIGLLGAIVSFATACGFAWSFRGPAKGDIEVDFLKPRKTWSSNEEWTERYIEKDATFGHRGIPNVAAIHHHREFNVTYDHDADGFRRMPGAAKVAPSRRDRVLGCSYTYGGRGERSNLPLSLGEEGVDRLQGGQRIPSRLGHQSRLCRVEGAAAAATKTGVHLLRLLRWSFPTERLARVLAWTHQHAVPLRRFVG
ncbi:MAG: hypothetical protein U1D30_18380 [Planctomycetota bacterium]